MNGGISRKATLSVSYPTLETDILLGLVTSNSVMEEMVFFIYQERMKFYLLTALSMGRKVCGFLSEKIVYGPV